MYEQDKIKLITVNHQPIIDLSNIQQGMAREPGMLHPTTSDLAQSYQENMAMAMLYQQLAVGYMRFEPLLTPQLRDTLAIPPCCPTIWELGSVFIDPSFRNKGLARELSNKLFASKNGRLLDGSTLVLGTTKNPRVLSATEDLQSVGISFYNCSHTDLPMVATFTCICNGEFGQGFQRSDYCPSRVTNEQKQFLHKRKLLPMLLQPDGSIPCTMFVSSQELATHTERILREKFSSQSNLVDVLRVNGYYGHNE